MDSILVWHDMRTGLPRRLGDAHEDRVVAEVRDLVKARLAEVRDLVKPRWSRTDPFSGCKVVSGRA